MVRMVTIRAAIETPKVIKEKALLGLMPNTYEAKAPVQAPVNGKGMATITTRARSCHLANFFLWRFRVFKKNQLAIFSKNGIYFINQFKR